MGRKVLRGGTAKPTVTVTREAKDAFAQWLEANDKPEQQSIVGKVLTWFIAQPLLVQDVVLGRVRPEVSHAYAAALQDMAKQVESGVTFTPDGLGAAISTAGSGPTASGSTPKSPPKFSVPRRTPQPVRSGARDRLPDV